MSVILNKSILFSHANKECLKTCHHLSLQSLSQRFNTKLSCGRLSALQTYKEKLCELQIKKDYGYL